MAPRGPEDISEDDPASNSESEEDSERVASSPEKLVNGTGQDGEIMEEYHTESDQDEEDNDEDGRVAITETAPVSAPLLPAELLKPLPSPAHSFQNAVNIPWDQMTRREKKAQRNRSRQAKKRVWDRLRQDAEGSGVLEAGRAAQMKRGIVMPKKDRVKKGRIEKPSRPKTSGRQDLLETRKRLLAEREAGPAKKKARKSRR